MHTSCKGRGCTVMSCSKATEDEETKNIFLLHSIYSTSQPGGGATHLVRLLGRLVPGGEQHVGKGGATGRVGGGGGARPAGL